MVAERAPRHVRRTRRTLPACFAAGVLLAGCAGGGITPIRTPFNRGVYHYSAGNLEEAVAEFRAALDEDDDDVRARFNLALALADLAERKREDGDAAGAEPLAALAGSEYREILRREPGHVRATVNLAALEIARGSAREGTRHLRAALAERPEEPLFATALAAHILREEDAPPARLVEAEVLLAQALASDATDVAANMLRGDAQRRLAALATEADERAELRAAARESYRRALKRAPADVATLVALAELDQELGDTAAARISLAKALAFDPGSLRAHRALAAVAESEGDLETAVAHLWRARDLERSEAARAAYEARLAELYRRLLAAAERDRAAARD